MRTDRWPIPSIWWRRPRPRRITSTLLALAAVGLLGRSAAELDAREQRLGPRVAVLVAIGDHTAGDRLDTDAVRRVELPRSMVPGSALDRLPTDRRLTSPVSDGEVVTDTRFANATGSATAARIPPEQRAFSIALGDDALGLAVGDHVDLLAPDPSGEVTVVAPGALVVARDGRSIAVAVPTSRVGAVAAASLAGTLAPSLVGSSDR